MKNKTAIVGIDNGVSGSLGVITQEKAFYYHTPIKKVLNYTKTKKWLNRINGVELKKILSSFNISKVLIERPMVNPGRFQATISAIRALEATLIILEDLRIPYEYCDSKEWQKVLLPKELEKEELKEASLLVAKRLFPNIDYKGFSDGDGLLIAEWARRSSLSSSSMS
jgi:hypothetical protein